MGDNSAIEWTDATWNPIVGCTRVGPGCDHCYAIGVVHRQMSEQHKGLTIKLPGEPTDWNGQVNVVPHLFDQPTRWRKPRRIFVNSLSDLFHSEVLTKEHDGKSLLVVLVAEMVANPRHTFQVLTKRPNTMRYVLSDPAFRLMVNTELMNRGLSVMHGGMTDPDFRWPPHIWWGTSIELDKFAWRADHLRRIGGTTWVSAEPLLGPLPSLELEGIDWLVVGGESGRGARPMHPQWARDLRDRCRGKVWDGVASVTVDGRTSTDVEVRTLPSDGPTAFFFKQWGDWSPAPKPPGPGDDGYDPRVQKTFAVLHDGKVKVPINVIGPLGDPPDPAPVAYMERVGKKVAGREIDGRTWDEMPAVAP